MKIKQAILAGSLTLLSLYYTSLQCFAEDETQDETDNLVSPYFWLDYANETKTVLDTLGLSEFSIEGWAIAAVAGLSFSAFSYWDDYYTNATTANFGDVIECSACAYGANFKDVTGHSKYGVYVTRNFSAKPPQNYYSYVYSSCDLFVYSHEFKSNSNILGSLSCSWSINSNYYELSLSRHDVSSGSSTSIIHQGLSIDDYNIEHIPLGYYYVDIPPHSIRFFVPPNISIPSVTSHAGDSPEFILSDIVDNVQKSVPSADLSEITEQIEGIIGASSGDYYDLPAPLFPNPGDQQLLPTMETVDESNATFSSALDGTLWWFQNFKSMFESDFFKQFLPFIILSLIFAVAYLILRW